MEEENTNSRDLYQEERDSSNRASGDTANLNLSVRMLYIKHFEDLLILIWFKESVEFNNFVGGVDLKQSLTIL